MGAEDGREMDCGPGVCEQSLGLLWLFRSTNGSWGDPVCFGRRRSRALESDRHSPGYPAQITIQLNQ